MVKLTKNEKRVLEKLAESGRRTDTEISKSLPVTQQAVHQIRKKLEEAGIVQGYIPLVDFEKIGISLIHLKGIEVRPELWKRITEIELNKRIQKIPYLYSAYRVPSGNISYILGFGFKDIKEQERFVKHFESLLATDFHVRWAYTLGIDNILAYDTLNLVINCLKPTKKSMKDVVADITK